MAKNTPRKKTVLVRNHSAPAARKTAWPKWPFHADVYPLLAIHATLALLIWLIYAQTYRFDFVNFDDPFYIMDNADLKRPFGIKLLFWAFTTGHFFNWHPLTYLTYIFDFKLFEYDAGPYHLHNVFWHLAAASCLFEAVRRLTGAPGRSAFVAACFAVHPLHVESVAWLSERKDVLCAAFFFAGLIAYNAYVKRPSPARYAVLAALYALALMGKSMAVTFPCVLLLLDYWPLGRLDENGEDRLFSPRRWGALLVEKIPLFLLTLVAGLITLIVQGSGGSVMSLSRYSVYARVSNAIESYFKYVFHMFWPRNLYVYYAHPFDSIPVWRALAAFAALALITGAALWVSFGRRDAETARRSTALGYLAVGWLWYLGTLVPVIGLLQVGLQGMADRYTYIPLVGLFVVVTWGVCDLAARRRVPGAALAAAGGVLVLALTWQAYAQTQVWRDTITLYDNVLKNDPGNSLGHNNLGEFLAKQNRFAEAGPHFAAAVKTDPNYAVAHSNLANILGMEGKSAEAETHYKKAIELDPTITDAHYNYAIELVKAGRIQEAILHYKEAIRLSPAFAFAHNNLAMELAKIGQVDEAIAQYEKAIQIDPAYENAKNNLRLLLKQIGRSL